MKNITSLAFLSLMGTSMATTYLTEFTQFGAPYTGASIVGNLNGSSVVMGGNDTFFGTEGWINAFTDESPLYSGAPYTYAEPNTDTLLFTTGTDSGSSSNVYTITFVNPATDPFLHIRGLEDTTIDFGMPFTLLSDDGGLASVGSTLVGSDLGGFEDGSGTIQFSGIYTGLSFDVSNSHFEPGNTIELAVGYDDAVAIPEPGSALLFGLSILAVMSRRKR